LDKSKIYGISFDESIPRGSEKRIMDAIGMQNDYAVDTAFQLNGGKNDFDKAYPFGAIRLCNVRMADGKKTVVYEGEPEFSRTGSSGNVMVEIPKFYARREKNGTEERWMISGTCHDGFSIEPCFVRGGKELDHVYVGVYNSTSKGEGVFSATGDFPDIMKTMDEFREEYRSAGFDCYDIAIHLALQRLMVIEFGRRDLKYILGGIGRMRYCSHVTPGVAIVALAPNKITIRAKVRGTFFAVGQEMGLGHTEKDMSIHRTVTHVVQNPDDPELVDVYYSGEDLAGLVEPGVDAAFGIPQRNGGADALPYHTGRWEVHAPLAPEENAQLSAFRYRNIENVWGSIWEFTAGLKVQQLNYYYTFDPEHYDAELSQWKHYPYPSLLRNSLPRRDDKTAPWVSEMGFDPDEPLLPLPTALALGTPGDYYDGMLYTYWDKDYKNDPIDPNNIYNTVMGGAFDHENMSLFCYRCFMLPGARHWLYGNRVCLRK